MMRPLIVTFIFLSASLWKVDAAVDMGGVKLEGLTDSLKMPDLSAFTGGKGEVKRKAQKAEFIPFFVAPPSLNSSVPVISTKDWAIEFECAQRGSDIIGGFVLDVKPSKEDMAVLVFSEEGGDEILAPPCETQFLLSPAEEGLRCQLDISTLGGGSDQTTVTVFDSSRSNIRFSDGSEVNAQDAFSAFVFTGAEGNDTLKNDFGIQSSCAAYGSLTVSVPKGSGLTVGDRKEKTEGGAGGLFDFKGGAGLPDLFNAFNFYVKSPALNSTVPIFSSPYADITYTCRQLDDEVFGTYELTLRGGQDGASILIDSDSFNGNPNFPSDCGDLDGLLTLAPGEVKTCTLVPQGVFADLTTVAAFDTSFELLLRFSNGLLISLPDDEPVIALTRVEGNSNFTDFFGAPSSCAAYGPLVLDVPKGMPFEVFTEPPRAAKAEGTVQKGQKQEDEDETDSPFKLSGLSDSLKLDFDLLGGLGGQKALMPSVGKENGLLSYLVAPPAFNTTVNVFSTSSGVSLDFACYVDEAAGVIRALLFMTVKAGSKKPSAFLTSLQGSGSPPVFLGLENCEGFNGFDDDITIVGAGEEYQCYLYARSVDVNERNVVMEDERVNDAAVQFSDGFQFSWGDEAGSFVLTGKDGNSTLTGFFDVPSSCAVFGPVNFFIPKGIKVDGLAKKSAPFPG